MRTTLTFVLMVLSVIGSLANPQAVAQQYVPAFTVPAPTETTLMGPNSYVGSPQPPQSIANSNPQVPGTAAPAASPAPTPDNGSPIDNGLWDGAPTESGCATCGAGDGCTPDWYLEQNVRILTRSRPRGIALSYDYNDLNAIYEVLGTRAASPDISSMWGMTFGHYFARDTQNRDHFVEFGFWGLNNWRDEAEANGHRLTSAGTSTTVKFGSLNSAYFFVPGGLNLQGFNYADQQTIFYTSSTNNFEINGRFTQRNRANRLVMQPNTGKWHPECQSGMYMSYLYGLRYFQLNETFRFHSESQIDTYDTDTSDLITSKNYAGDYDVVAHNNLLGLQFGAEMLFRDCRWTWGIRSKIGPYVNFSDQVSNISAGNVLLDPSYSRRIASSRHEASFIGELGFEATYKFRPNLVGRASYDFMWVTGLAFAPEQLQFQVEPINKINTNGLGFFHGITLGLEWLW